MKTLLVAILFTAAISELPFDGIVGPTHQDTSWDKDGWELESNT